MIEITEQFILALEQRLRDAMVQSDVTVLDELLAPDLIFTNHMGQVISKEDDLEAHRSGILKISRIEPSDTRIRLAEKFATVSVRVFLAGSYGGVQSETNFRFTRIWTPSSGGSWQIAVGHSCIIV